MSFFGMGGRPQLSSEQKIAQAEAEVDMVSDMYSRYVISPPSTVPYPYHHIPNVTCRPSTTFFRHPSLRKSLANTRITDSSNPAHPNASTPRTAKPTSTKANPSAWTAASQSSSRSMSRLARRCRARRKGRLQVVAPCLAYKMGLGGGARVARKEGHGTHRSVHFGQVGVYDITRHASQRLMERQKSQFQS
jgi:hypothetical protein